MWYLIPAAAVLGAGLYEIIRPAAKTEVVQFTPNPKVADLSARALNGAKVDYEMFTDGVNSWIMVKPSDRTAAVQAVKAVLQVAKL